MYFVFYVKEVDNRRDKVKKNTAHIFPLAGGAGQTPLCRGEIYNTMIYNTININRAGAPKGSPRLLYLSFQNQHLRFAHLFRPRHNTFHARAAGEVR